MLACERGVPLGANELCSGALLGNLEEDLEMREGESNKEQALHTAAQASTTSQSAMAQLDNSAGNNDQCVRT